jgi:peptidoglycan hydrolase-like amidase
MLALAIATTVKIGVFGLFHPVQLDVKPAHGQVLMIESNGRSQVVEGSASVRLRSDARVTGRGGAEAAFVLSVPGKISREFHGRLDIRQQGATLMAIVEMDRETAVPSIVAAEGSEATPVEARKAQAVVARSFLAAAHGRHRDFDFCDTTHCQFLREPAAASSAANRASVDTRGLMLTYQGNVIPALYSANCGGHTRAMAESDWRGEDTAYPYFGVECPVKGAVSGHRVGMCQVGAAEMAKRGATFREILQHYFPATVTADVR